MTKILLMISVGVLLVSTANANYANSTRDPNNARDANNTSNADCPTLDLKTLPKAACATEENPYKTGPLSRMSYVSRTPCPSGVGLRKMLQGMFKGPKSYPGYSMGITPGMVTCTYRLEEDWQKRLGVTNQQLVLKAQITKPGQVNYLGSLKCPVLGENEAEIIKQKEAIELTSTRDESISYSFTPSKLQQAGTISRIKNVVSGKQNIGKLNGILKVIEPFRQHCEYQHKTGGSPMTLLLEGMQDVMG